MDGTENTPENVHGTQSTERVPYRQVTVAEAADQLGVSVVTIRRMIKRGQLEAQRVVRPQGSAYLVTVPDDGTEDASPREQPAQNVSRTQGTPEQAITAMIQATLAPVLAPLVAEITASRQTIERQAETIGELRATVATLEARTAAQVVAPPMESAGALWAFLTRWWPLLATVVVATVLAAVLLVGPR
jgi:excisionase family DNA binding protein